MIKNDAKMELKLKQKQVEICKKHEKRHKEMGVEI